MVCVWHERTQLQWFKSCCYNHMFCQSSTQKMILKTFNFVKMSCPSDPARLICFQSWTLFSRSHPDSNRVAFRSGWSSGVKGCWFKPCNECIQCLFFIHWSVLRFWALLLFIKCFKLVERNHPKYTSKCFYCTISIFICRFQLWYL